MGVLYQSQGSLLDIGVSWDFERKTFVYSDLREIQDDNDLVDKKYVDDVKQLVENAIVTELVYEIGDDNQRTYEEGVYVESIEDVRNLDSRLEKVELVVKDIRPNVRYSLIRDMIQIPSGVQKIEVQSVDIISRGLPIYVSFSFVLSGEVGDRIRIRMNRDLVQILDLSYCYVGDNSVWSYSFVDLPSFGQRVYYLYLGESFNGCEVSYCSMVLMELGK